MDADCASKSSKKALVPMTYNWGVFSTVNCESTNNSKLIRENGSASKS